MNTTFPDVLKQEFLALWSQLAKAGTPPLAIAGGYGLLLKQVDLRERGGFGVLVPLERWGEATPRTTKDLDLVIDLDFIRDAGDQKSMVGVLEARGFTVTERNPRWQFSKRFGESSVVVEFHAMTPPEEMTGLFFNRHHIKHRPSLGEDGIHARHNQEAACCELHPLLLTVEGIDILLPNPVTWCVMKLTAMADCHDRSRELSRSEKDRTYWRLQAEKHAADVCRIVAMTSRSEAANALEVKSAIKESTAYSLAQEIARDYFIADDDGWGVMATERFWETGDLRAIRDLLGEWFA